MSYTTDLNFEIIRNKFNQLLKYKKWVLSGNIPEVAEIWKKEIKNSQRAEVFIPINHHVDNWNIAFKDAIKTICKTENWDEETVNNFIISNKIFQETVSLRAFGYMCINNTLPIDYAEILHTGIAKLLKISTKKFFEKESINNSDKRKKSELIKQFTSSLRLAQSSVGSYVINIEIPTANNSSFDSDSFSGISHEIDTEVSNLLAATKSIDNHSLKKLNINKELCDAVLSFGGISEDQDVEIILQKFSPYSNELLNKKVIKINKELYQPIRLIRTFLEEKNISTKKNISGFVTRLDKEFGEISGIVFIDCKINEKRVKLKIKLNTDDYKKAIKAHDNDLVVNFSCKVSRIGNRWFGDEINNFLFVNNSSLI